MQARHLVRVDVRTRLVDEKRVGHNRWHPSIPPIARIAPGEVTALDLRDGLDGHITRTTEAGELAMAEWDVDIPMTGPLFIQGAEPGDLLEVETLHIDLDSFAFTPITPGSGLLGHRVKSTYLVKWDIRDGAAKSGDLPRVRIPGAPFLGLMGVAPSPERIESLCEREEELARRASAVKLPKAANAVPDLPEIGRRGLRATPPREFGGNMDIRQLTAGSKVTFPVEVPGALFSAGDPHFAQGDGESGGAAIEMSATAYLRFSLRKASSLKWRPRYPFFQFLEPAAGTPPRPYFATTGLPIDVDGRNQFLDLNTAATQALEQMIEYLTIGRGYTTSQAYVIASVAVDLRISQVVDAPNAIVSALLPLDIFVT